ncbi:probable tubulin polyglutamylase TTLL2 [Thalassophryne amazonica]|uniref:probable tubulin polyglutamylase TTLL2 n=1 Tax=Thalassophryne amazonica TaxID=390379 RepID=UPI00147128F7|nr:probable tubulin polyglutamylase TTLL2 [Thalassophryne amazonica]
MIQQQEETASHDSASHDNSEAAFSEDSDAQHLRQQELHRYRGFLSTSLCDRRSPYSEDLFVCGRSYDHTIQPASGRAKSKTHVPQYFIQLTELTRDGLLCMAAAVLVFKLEDGRPEVLREVLLERGWEEYNKRGQEEEDWNLYWRASAFHISQYRNLLPWQRLNHHPKTAGITRKDCLARNLRRMRATFGSASYDFSPTTFVLPNDYTHFLTEHNKQRLTRGPAAYWICKPVDLSRGRQIFIFQDMKDLVYDCAVIVQRYISNPLLISGYKFDLRIYVCVKSFHPLTVYVHQEGLVRFATEKYNLSSLHNLYAHLTNTSINKSGPFYSSQKERVGQGCKWSMSKFRHFLHSQEVDDLLLWQRINNIITLTLLAVAPSVPCCPNCVELFGFDILIDVKFKPWLLEVNYSPALTLDCQTDVSVKKALIGDLIDLMNYTPADSLRNTISHKQGCFRANQRPHLPKVVPNCSEGPMLQKRRVRQELLPPKLPLQKTLPRHRKCSRLHVAVPDGQSFLPTLTLHEMSADRLINTHNTAALHQSHHPHLRTNGRMCAVHRRTHYKPDATNHETNQTEAELVPSALPDDITWRGRRHQETQAQKLPPTHSWRCRWRQTPPQGTRSAMFQQVPPVRIGDFILTFPFNSSTLKASQHKLDLKTVIQELHMLTAQLGSGRGQTGKKKNSRREEELNEDFGSLLWGPKDPPLLSQCLRGS